MKKLYLIGSLRNKEIPTIANSLRKIGFDVFDDWFSPGPRADEEWKKYEKRRGRSYKEAMQGYHAKHVFEFDKHHLDTSDFCVLVLPAGRSGHLELGYLKGLGRKCYILLEKNSDRWDIMYQFADGIYDTIEELENDLKTEN